MVVVCQSAELKTFEAFQAQKVTIEDQMFLNLQLTRMVRIPFFDIHQIATIAL